MGLKVLFVIHGATFGGPHNQALRLAGPLRERGYETVVLVPNEPGNAAARLRDGGVEVLTIPLHRVRATPDPIAQLAFGLAFAPEVLRLRRIIGTHGIDLVQIGGLVNPHAAIAARSLGIPVVWQLLDTRAPRPIASAAMLFVRALADAVMPTGRRVLSAFPGSERLGRRIVPFIPPVDTDAFRPRPEMRADVRREWGIGADDLVVGCVANLNPQKGVDGLVQAFGEARRSVPGARLVLIGAEYEAHAAYSRAIRDRMGEAELVEGRDVLFLGARADIDGQMQGFDVLALAAVPRSEGIPTVLLEAMASGVPVVATDVGGVAEVVEDGVTGRVVPPLDAGAMAQALTAVLAGDDARGTMAAAARETAERRFALEHCAETHVKAYEQALARGRA